MSNPFDTESRLKLMVRGIRRGKRKTFTIYHGNIGCELNTDDGNTWYGTYINSDGWFEFTEAQAFVAARMYGCMDLDIPDNHTVKFSRPSVSDEEFDYVYGFSEKYPYTCQFLKPIKVEKTIFTPIGESEQKIEKGNKTMNYRKAADEFVMVAFDLLDRHKKDPNSEYCRGTTLVDSVAYGEPWYVMSISKKGQLRVIDTRKRANAKTITHAYNKNESQITAIGKMLAKYLDILQRENGDL